jgi:hypothetical protein
MRANRSILIIAMFLVYVSTVSEMAAKKNEGLQSEKSADDLQMKIDILSEIIKTDKIKIERKEIWLKEKEEELKRKAQPFLERAKKKEEEAKALDDEIADYNNKSFKTQVEADREHERLMSEKERIKREAESIISEVYNSDLLEMRKEIERNKKSLELEKQGLLKKEKLCETLKSYKLNNISDGPAMGQAEQVLNGLTKGLSKEKREEMADGAKKAWGTIGGRVNTDRGIPPVEDLYTVNSVNHNITALQNAIRNANEQKKTATKEQLSIIDKQIELYDLKLKFYQKKLEELKKKESEKGKM